MNPPSVHRRALITWLAIYPGITVLSVLLGPVLAPLPVYLRTLVLTGILVPAAVYGLVPALLRANAALTGRRRSGRSAAAAAAGLPAPAGGHRG
ncbi:hypothetical protein [Kitasatospora sp. CB01950]|uniref:hypothetical protein n=1 Tax=Kitasatospora sp. CB01950 TaxID=1703930 RepID=UPI00093C0A8D|nr:hypothetical protein [Kitasatospora sp. CB01950]OKI99879.1 hypothetical protein AMK19_30595 [Kitasatospora sp. CB01950]